MWYYQTKKDDSEVIDKLKELAESHPTRGFDEYYKKLRREGYKWNRKRVLRVYRNMKLSLRRKHKKRLVSRVKNPLVAPKELNVCWSMDFMSDALYDGRKVRTFNVIDDCNREALAIDVGLNYPSRRVIETL
jgi:putative transposase